MNDKDQFELRLQGRPLRPVPPDWREEILRAARAAATGPAPVAKDYWSAAAAWLRSLLWPHPRAWAGLSALWLVILGLNLAGREPSPQALAGSAAPPSPQMRELLRQQEQLLAELVGPPRRPKADRPKPPVPQPRSQFRTKAANA